MSELIWPTHTHISLSPGTWLPIQKTSWSIHEGNMTGVRRPRFLGHSSVCKKIPGTGLDCIQIQAVPLNGPVSVRTTSSLPFLLFSITPLFLEAMVRNLEIMGGGS